jgi:hypothetical protein
VPKGWKGVPKDGGVRPKGRRLSSTRLSTQDKAMTLTDRSEV